MHFKLIDMAKMACSSGLLFLLVLFISISSVSADSAWVLKDARLIEEKIAGKDTWCDPGLGCVSPTASIGRSSAKATAGWEEPDGKGGKCTGTRIWESTWDEPPATLVPGEIITSVFNLKLSGETSCEGYGGFARLYAGVYLGYLTDEANLLPYPSRMTL